ncbi:MAG: hypothetical protein RLZZ585_790 [Bacteroidota bacterium]
MSRGTVKFFNESKGFGFIIEDDTNKEYEGRKGLNAINVKKA